jgi:pilus assembly protein CpaE
MSILQTSTPIERQARTPAGRSQLVGFVADPESEGIPRDCLGELGMGQATIASGGIRKAIQHLSAERSPHILIVDISDVDLPVSEMHHLAEVCEPGVTVIALGKRNDIGLYRDLLQSGVTDYLVKPLTHQLVAKSLNAAMGNVVASPINQKLGKLVTFIGARGGVGTSTLAVNLAWFLSNRQKRRVALVDLDLRGGDCALMLSVKPTEGLRDALENPMRVDSIFLERTMIPHSERLFVLASEEPFREPLRIEPEAVETLLSVIRSQFHYVIVDVPDFSLPYCQRAVDLAEVRVIVADQTLRSVRDTVRLRPMLGEADAMRRNLLVINRSGENGRHEVRLDDFNATTEMRPKCVIPYRPKLFAGALQQAKLAVGKTGRLFDEINALATDISGRTRKPARRRWRLFG